MNKTALCIVAHPDDETIWMGGTIMKNNYNWTIICLCRKNDLDRSPKFKKVCDYYKAKSIISDLDDEKLKPLTTQSIVKKIKSLLPKLEYDIIFTHGENGEYGHLRHKEIYTAVKKMIKNKQLKAKEVYYFSYELKSRKIPWPTKGYELKTELTKSEHKGKIQIITDIYGFADNSFEALSCNNIETFTCQDAGKHRPLDHAQAPNTSSKSLRGS